jgi:DegV family protein with EDD domain
MQKVTVITDSVSGLTRELREKYNIGIVPIRLLVKGKVYRDLIDMTPSEAYQFLAEEPEHFATSPSSPWHYMEAYKEARLKANNILCITISSGLSNAANVARMAKEQAAMELPGVNIEVMDSKSVTAAEGFIVLAAARAAADGKELPEAVQEAEYVKERVTFVAVLETMEYVYRTGRIPKVASQLGSVLNIKPILTISSGLIHVKHIVRNMETGINRILTEMKEKVGESPTHIAVMHADVPEGAEKLKQRIESEFNCAELWITEFTPVMGYATGRGTIGVAYYAD